MQDSIEEFNVANNQLSKIALKIVGNLIKAKTINFTGNSCIDMSYEVGQKNGKTFAELALKIKCL